MFKNLLTLIQTNMDTMFETNQLFITQRDRDAIYETYLNSFPEETNPIFRVKREFDCNCCKSFIRQYGSIVTIENNQLVSIWDNGENLPYPFNLVSKAMEQYVKSNPIESVFYPSLYVLGTEKSVDTHDNSIIWNHFSYRLPKNYKRVFERDLDTIYGKFNNFYTVLSNSLEKISLDSIDIVLDLIASNSLYRGDQYLSMVTEFKQIKIKFNENVNNGINNALFIWKTVRNTKENVMSIKNTAIGTLLLDLTEGIDINVAVSSYERITAPTNYKRPKEIFTAKMLEEAKQNIINLGYEDSLSRRFANIFDIRANDLIFIDRSIKNKTKDVFDQLQTVVETKAVDMKQFDRVEEISISDFISNIIPTTTELSLLFENKLEPSLFSLIAPVVEGSKSMFPWSNGFSWTYNGNLTDSGIQQKVVEMGGNIHGIMRASIDWSGRSNHDLDLHCALGSSTSSTNHIYYGNLRAMGGSLDVDVRVPSDRNHKNIVENIVFPNRNIIQKGIYTFWIDTYSARQSFDNPGVAIQMEIDGKIYDFDYRGNFKELDICTVEYDGTNFITTFNPELIEKNSTKEIWGIKTNQFHKVKTLLYSPNYWESEKNPNGLKHYMFVLENCINPEQPRGFFNEFLSPELVNHRRVFEALGSRMIVEKSNDQLSGIGLNSTSRNDVIAKVSSNNITRVFKIKF